MTRDSARPAGRTIASRRGSAQQPPVAGLYELGRALGSGQTAPEEVSRRQADRDYWAGYADAVSDLYGAADRPLDVPDAPEQTDASARNVTDLAAYRCGVRAVRPRGDRARRAEGGR